MWIGADTSGQTGLYIGPFTNHGRTIEKWMKSRFVFMLDVRLKDAWFVPNDPVITMITLDMWRQHLMFILTFLTFLRLLLTLHIFLPVGFQQRGGREASWSPWLLPWAFRTRWCWGQLWSSVLHPIVLRQPPFRDCLVVTLVTGESIWNGFHFTKVHWWRVLLPFQELPSPPCISSQGGGARVTLS